MPRFISGLIPTNSHTPQTQIRTAKAAHTRPSRLPDTNMLPRGAAGQSENPSHTTHFFGVRNHTKKQRAGQCRYTRESPPPPLPDVWRTRSHKSPTQILCTWNFCVNSRTTIAPVLIYKVSGGGGGDRQPVILLRTARQIQPQVLPPARVSKRSQHAKTTEKSRNSAIARPAVQQCFFRDGGRWREN